MEGRPRQFAASISLLSKIWSVWVYDGQRILSLPLARPMLVNALILVEENDRVFIIGHVCCTLWCGILLLPVDDTLDFHAAVVRASIIVVIIIHVASVFMICSSC